ncbi:MAG: hypothetical protein UR78_C0001G0069 [Candidatus Moranbacteria bacterium GW2011_GWF2_35_39]|nr:MAG: hypothetical protein UR78_C0001G0069 [Candidatus Moranbacteria bacterium GW2011_GWF2_35_39]
MNGKQKQKQKTPPIWWVFYFTKNYQTTNFAFVKPNSPVDGG